MNGGSTCLYRGTNPVKIYETELIPAETVMANSKTNWIQWNLPKCPIDLSTMSKSKPVLLTSSSEPPLFQHFIFVFMATRLNLGVLENRQSLPNAYVRISLCARFHLRRSLATNCISPPAEVRYVRRNMVSKYCNKKGFCCTFQCVNRKDS